MLTLLKIALFFNSGHFPCLQLPNLAQLNGNKWLGKNHGSKGRIPALLLEKSESKII